MKERKDCPKRKIRKLNKKNIELHVVKKREGTKRKVKYRKEKKTIYIKKKNTCALLRNLGLSHFVAGALFGDFEHECFWPLHKMS